MTDAEPLWSLGDLESCAPSCLPADVRDFIAGGSGDESALAANRAALDAVRVPRALVDEEIAAAAVLTIHRTRSEVPWP